MTKTVVLSLLLGVSLGRPVEDQTHPSTASPQITQTSPQLEQRDLTVTADDLAILVRTQALLKSNSVWNRADERECKDDEASGKRSLFCALQKACIDVLGSYDHHHRVPGGQLADGPAAAGRSLGRYPPGGIAARLGPLAIRPAARQDRTTQVVMNHPIHRVTRFSVVGPFTLVVTFADGTEQRIDFKPVLHGPLFGPLQDLATFNGVRLDAEAGTLVWPNDADFDPATLHDWPDVGEELATRARAWAVSANDQQANKRMEPTRR